MPAGYRAGIPQQPYTKYESDNDEIKVEYKRVDSVQRMQWFDGYKGSILRILVVIIIFMLGLILGYVIRRTVRELPLQSGASGDDHPVKSEVSLSEGSIFVCKFIDGFSYQCHWWPRFLSNCGRHVQNHHFLNFCS